jgi:hypothetical protein
MKNLNRWLFASCIVLAGCSSGQATRGGTLLYGLNQYHGELQRAGSGVSSWPARQQAAGEFKVIINAMLGTAPEFQRLVDLDLRKREFVITLRDTNVRPERRKEMEDELVQMDDEIAALKPVIKTQLAAHRLHEQPNDVDAIATLGLLGIALDGFSSTSSRGAEAPATKVGQYLVTDFGTFAKVRAANGKNYRCNLFGSLDDGAGVRCEPGN